MKRLIVDHLKLYRRHSASCSEQKPSVLDSCECPLWVHGRLGGEFVRLPLDTRALATGDFKRKELLARGRRPDPTPAKPAAGVAGIHVIAPSKPSPEPAGDIPLDYAVSEFLKAKERKASNTLKNYSTTVEHFLGFAHSHGSTFLKQIDTPQVQQYFREFEPIWKSRNTRQNRLVFLRVFFNYCVRERRWLTHSPTASRDLNYRKVAQSSKRRPFTPEEITRIVAAIELLPEELRVRARALILLLLYTGMRISDATFFERESLTYLETADYWVIKTRKQIALPVELQPVAIAALEALPVNRVYFFQPDREGDYEDARNALRNGEEFSQFMTEYDARIRETTSLVTKVLALAGIDGACHRFRDTFAINMLVGGADIFTVSQMLGHSDVRITQEHYLKLIPGYRERMSQATRKLAYQLRLAG